MKTRFQISTLVLPAIVIAGWIAGTALASTLAYNYDAAGRLVTASYAANTNFIYAYDAASNLRLSAAPTPALVMDPPAAGQVTLTWPAVPAGYVLQRSLVLGTGANWINTGITPVLSGNLLTASVPVGSQAAFYRLMK